MKNFCIVTNRTKDADLSFTKQLTAYLEEKKVRYCILQEINNENFGYADYASVPEDTDCCIVLGGDGTMIQAARNLVGREIPIIGINLGTLGFMSTVELPDIKHAVDALVNDDFTIENRMMIWAARPLALDEALEAEGTSGKSLSEEENSEYIALNDVVISKGSSTRLISLNVYVNGSLVSTYNGDGVIVATPTGSTGYSLSGGGPVVTPEAELMVITPICPHTMNSRSIVTSNRDSIVITFEERNNGSREEAVVVIDGQERAGLTPGSAIKIGCSKKKTKLIRLKEYSFFKLLHAKLK